LTLLLRRVAGCLLAAGLWFEHRLRFVAVALPPVRAFTGRRRGLALRIHHHDRVHMGLEGANHDTLCVLVEAQHVPWRGVSGSHDRAEIADLRERLAGTGVLIRNVSGYPDLPGFLRVTAGTERENKAFLTALKSAL